MKTGLYKDAQIGLQTNKNDISNFWKFYFYMGTIKNNAGDGSTMTQEMLFGLLVISKKSLNAYLAVFACKKK